MSLAEAIARSGSGLAGLDRGERGAVVRQRLVTLLEALGRPVPPDRSGAALLHALDRALRPVEQDTVWLSLAVLTGRLPDAASVQRTSFAAELDGPVRALGAAGALRKPGLVSTWRDDVPEVEVVSGQVLVDMEHTAQTSLATGIQRVARQTVKRWARDHDVVLVGWTPDLQALRRLDPAEEERALHGTTPRPSGRAGASRRVLVPWQATYLLPELATEDARTRRMSALARFSRSRTGAIGFDCVPVTSGETVAEGMGAGFAGNLAAIRHMQRLTTISDAAGVEYLGWRSMLAGAGLTGPDIRPIALPIEAARAPDRAALDRVRARLKVGGLPMVLVVGSHEPRKNHLAVLHATEVLWRRGFAFSVVFIGGNAWRSEAFQRRLAELQGAGRPVESISAVTDELLWSAYHLAHCVVFPSLNEGFGLPVAEALAVGTPVVTSRHGSMAELARGGGALLVDPRDDDDLVEGMARLLRDENLYAELRQQARARDHRTWDDYARETWAYLVDGVRDSASTTDVESRSGA